MIASQERVIQLCKEKNIAVSQLEKDCGFSNGYIATERKREFPANKLTKIAARLDTTIDFLMYGKIEKKEPAATNSNELAEKVSRLSPELLIKLNQFLELAKDNQESAIQFLSFAVQALQSSQQSR